MNNIKVLLEIDSSVYDEKIKILIPGAISKMKIEGVNEIKIGDLNYEMYIVCLSYQVALDLALDVDMNTMYRKYITYVNILRSRIE